MRRRSPSVPAYCTEYAQQGLLRTLVAKIAMRNFVNDVARRSLRIYPARPWTDKDERRLQPTLKHAGREKGRAGELEQRWRWPYGDAPLRACLLY